MTTSEGRRVVWHYGKTLAGVLRLVDAAALDGFRQRRRSEGGSSNTSTNRLYRVTDLHRKIRNVQW